MKRVRHFEVLVIGPSEGGDEESFEMSSWHRIHDLARERLAAGSSEVQVKVSTGEVVAIFSDQDLRAEEEETAKPPPRNGFYDPNDEADVDSKTERRSWETVKFSDSNDRQWCENRNVKDFFWQLLDGARHELPFSLNYFERKALNNPNGLYAYGMSLVHQWNDMFNRRR